jgi:ABC-type uncharacterized transport system permease subunit
MWRLRAYWRVLAISASEEGANPKRLISAVVQLLARLALIVAIYQAAYLANPNPGLSYQNAVWSIGMYLAFVMALGIRQVSRMIDLEIKAGNVETHIIKPLDWRLVILCRLLGRSGLEFLCNLVVIPLMLALFVGLPDVSFVAPWMAVVFVFIMVFVAAAVSAIFITVGMSAFWLNDAQSVYRIVDKTMAAFAGAFVPIALLPAVIQEFVRVSPFGVYASLQNLFNPRVAELMIPTIISAVVWTIVLIAFCQWVWKRAERRIEVNGG